jgi:hypothetical protein
VYINGNVGIGTNAPTARLDVSGSIAAGGLITANGGLTAGGSTSISLPNNGASSYYCGTNGSGANIRMYGNGTDAFIDYYGQFNYRSVNNTGATVLATPFTISSAGLATFNNGLTMGGANNITLGTGATAPTTGQLGYTISVTPYASVSTAYTKVANSITLTTGVWLISFKISIQNTVGGEFLYPFLSSQIITERRYPFEIVPPTGTERVSDGIFVFIVSTSSTFDLNVAFTPGAGTIAINTGYNYSYIQATRIA